MIPATASLSPPHRARANAPASEPDRGIAAWAEAADRQPDAHLAHAPEWAVAVGAYGHPARCLVVPEPGGPAILPTVLIRRPLLGARLVSMPFLDGGGPLARTGAARDALVQQMLIEAAEAGAAAIELRTAERLAVDIAPRTEKVNMVLQLPAAPPALWQRLSPKVRNQVRKAERAGLVLREGGTELLDAFYAIFSENMRDLGSPVHARAFFAATLAAFGTGGRLLVVERDGDTLGGLVALGFKDTLYVPWASCLRRHAALCPNMLLYWGILERATREGFRRFDFGRSTRGSGTYQFKRQWGADEVPLYWYTIPLRAQRTAGSQSAGLHRLSRIWQKLPLSVSRLLGPRIRRYLSQ